MGTTHPIVVPVGAFQMMCLIRVSDSFDYGSGVYKIGLAYSDSTGSTCTITCWGRTGNSYCQSRMSGVSGATINDGHICVFDSSYNRGSCNGDSGGPLKCGSSLAGITSWGISSSGICRQDYPSVYTRVSHFRSWIVSIPP